MKDIIYSFVGVDGRATWSGNSGLETQYVRDKGKFRLLIRIIIFICHNMARSMLLHLK